MLLRRGLPPCCRKAPLIVVGASRSVRDVQTRSGAGDRRKIAPDTFKASSPEMEEAIREKLVVIMGSSEWDSLTERKIRDELSQQLGESVEPYKELIKVLVDQIITSRAAGLGDDKDLDPEVGKKRKNQADSSQPLKAKKTSGGRPKDFVVDLSGKIKASVGVFKDNVLVDLREFYEDNSGGGMQPGKRGISLKFGQWMLLKAQLPALVKLSSSNKETQGEPLQLSSDRQAYIKEFKGKYLVHVREMYTKNGQVLPGTKGVALDSAGAAKLLAAAEDITAAALERGEPADVSGEQSAAPPSTATAQQQGTMADVSRKQAAATPSSAPSTASAVESSMQQNVRPAEAPKNDSLGFVDLGAERRATVTTFKGKTYVDLRQYFSNESGTGPTPIGIMLTPEQFRKLAKSASEIGDALSDRNQNFQLNLDSRRSVTVSEFKGNWSVGVREFYESAGQLRPTKKGLNMNMEQWQKFVAGLPSLEASLNKS